MKMLTKDAIEMLKNSYDPNEMIFIWTYDYEIFEIDRETGESVPRSTWDDVDDNFDTMDEIIRDGITMLLRP